MLNHNDTIRIERVIEGANWQHSKNGFLKSAPHHTFLVSYESGRTYDSIAQKTTLIHAEMTEIQMTQVTPQNHTRAQKSARVQGWLKTTISTSLTWPLSGLHYHGWLYSRPRTSQQGGNGSRQKDLHEYLGRIAPELNFELGPLYSNLRQRI